MKNSEKRKYIQEKERRAKRYKSKTNKTATLFRFGTATSI